MIERPILFSAPMVRAILAGTKTQTRRICKKQPTIVERLAITWRMLATGEWHSHGKLRSAHTVGRCPYGQPGDRLWVREAWTVNLTGDAKRGGPGTVPIYRASTPNAADRWRPSIHMPRWASRLTLEITGVRVERLQAISEVDALAEGISRLRRGGITAYFGGTESCGATAGGAYAELWKHLNGAGSWDADPWVWVIEFKVLRG